MALLHGSLAVDGTVMSAMQARVDGSAAAPTAVHGYTATSNMAVLHGSLAVMALHHVGCYAGKG